MKFHNLFYTPKECWKATMIAILYWVLYPINTFLLADYVRFSSKYPSHDVDASGFGAAIFLVFWLIMSPIVIMIFIQILRNYPGRVSLFTWNEKKRQRSVIWTGIIGFLIAAYLLQFASDIFTIPPRLCYDAFNIFMLACARAVIVAKPGQLNSTTNNEDSKHA